jgi:hypothetical protein
MSDDTPDMLIKRAEDFPYRAIHSGRDRILAE